jgi:hypothetical protein
MEVLALRVTKKQNVAGLVLMEFGQRIARVREAHPEGGRWLGRAMPESLERFLTRIRTIEIQRALTLAAIALERYKLKHGAYPVALAALSPEFVKDPIRDPIDGKPLRYGVSADGSFVLYSIGENGVDDGGNPEPMEGFPRQWWRARDAVWPRPATPDEVKGDFEKVLVQFRKSQDARNRQTPGSALDQFRKRYGLLPAPSGPTNAATNR